MLAVWRGFTGSIELLISYGADLDAVDRVGDTVLHLATIRLTMAQLMQEESLGGSESNSPVLDQVCGMCTCICTFCQSSMHACVSAYGV